LSLLLIYQIAWSVVSLAGAIAVRPAFWSGNLAPFHAARPGTEQRVLSTLFGYIALQLGAALLLLLWRRWGAVRLSLILQWSTVLAGVVLYFRLTDLLGFDATPSALKDAPTMLATAMTGFLLKSPQLRTAYGASWQSSLSSDAGQTDVFVPAARWRPEISLWLLILFAALSCALDITQLPGDGIGLLRAVLSFTMPAALPYYMPLMFHAGGWFLIAILLICYRRWLSIQITLIFLWACALYDSGVVVAHYAARLPDILLLMESDRSFALSMVIKMTEVHLLYLIRPAAALAWTGYLLSSSYVRARYPGGRQRGMAEVDADIF
jgi:hypothetical protein